MANEVKIKLAVDGAASVNTELSGVEGRLDRLTGAVKNSAHYGAGLAAAFGLVIPAISGTVRASIAAADAVTTLQNSLKLATGSAEKAGQAYEALFAIAQQSRVSFTELGGTFASISRAGQELGISQTRLLTVTQAIGQAMTISGGSAQGMQAALTQLGQGLASGTLRGEELNSVMEQAPRLAQALADGMGVPIGRLREMGAAGEITAEQVISALEKSAPQLAKEVAGATLTVSQAFTVLTNEAVKFAGDADKASGATDTLSKALVNLSSGLSTVGSFIREHETAFSVLTTTLASAAVAAGIYATGAAVLSLTGALVAMGTAVMAHPVLLVIGGIAAGVMALDQVNKGYAKTVRGMGEEVTRLSERINAAEKVLAGTKGGSELTRQMEERVAAMKKVRAELQGQLALSSVKGLDTTAEDARLARHTKAVKDQARAEEDLAKLRLKLSGVPDGYLKDMNEIIRLNQAGVLTGKAYTDALKTQQDALLKKTGATKTAAKDTANAYATEQDAAKHWADAMQDGGKMLADVEAKSLGLNAAQMRLKDLMADPLWAQMPEVWRDMAAAKLTEASAAIEARTAHEADTRAITEQNAGWQRNVETLQQRIDALDDEARAASLAKSQNIGLAQAVELVGIARLREQQYAAEAAGNYAMVDALQREIDERQKLARMVGEKESRETTEKTAKDAADAWQKTADSIYEGLTDSLYRAFESGKGFFNTLWSSIKNAFKTTVLKLAVQGVLGGVLGGLAGGAGATGSVVGNIGTAASIFNAGSSLLGGGLLASNAAYGAALGTASIGAGSQAAMLAAQTGTFGASGLAATAEAAGGAMGNAMSFALDPVTLGIAALVAVIASLDDSGTYHTGGASSYSAAGGLRAIDAATLGTADVVRADATESMTAGVSKAIVSMLDTTALAFGKTAGYSAATAFADDTSDDGAWGALVISKLGETVLDWADTQTSKWAPKEFADGETGTKQYTAALAASVREALDSIGLPAWAQGMLNNLGSAPSMEALSAVVEDINATRRALLQMGDALVGFAGLSDAANTILIGASGGISALATNASAYYDAFYSAGEKVAVTASQVARSLQAVGVTMPALATDLNGIVTNGAAARTEYRALVEAQTALGDAGAPALAVLLATSSAFAGITESAAEASASTQTLSDTVATYRDLAARLGDTRKELLAGDLSPLSPAQKYAQAQAAFASTSAGARAGDAAALGRMADASKTLLEASRANSASALDYAADFAAVQRALGDAATSASAKADVAQLQLTALQTQVSLLDQLNTTAQSMADALAPASAVQINPTATITPVAALDGSHADGLAYVPWDGYRAELHQGERVLTAAENRNFGAGPAGIGRTDRLEQLVTQLNAQVAGLRAEARATAVHTNATNRKIDRLMPDGDALAVRITA